jgi:hypothetical protein
MAMAIHPACGERARTVPFMPFVEQGVCRLERGQQLALWQGR